jgi:cell division septation protein DedD
MLCCVVMASIYCEKLIESGDASRRPQNTSESSRRCVLQEIKSFTLAKLNMLLSAANRLPPQQQTRDMIPQYLTTTPPASTTTSSLTAGASSPSRRTTTFQCFISYQKSNCFQGGAGAPAEPVRTSCSRLVDKGYRQHRRHHEFDSRQLRRLNPKTDDTTG